MEIITQTFKNFSRHFMVWGIVLMGLMIGMQPSPTAPVEHNVPGSLESVTDSVDCKDTIEGVFPTGVILRKVGGGHYFTANDTKIGKALDESVAGIEWSSHEVIRFCR